VRSVREQRWYHPPVMEMVIRGMLAAPLLAFLSLAFPGQQSSQPTPFRSRAEYVEVDAFVTDAQGRFVRTLQKDDFTVLEDGKRVPVSTLELVDLPRSTAALTAPSSDVVTTPSRTAVSTSSCSMIYTSRQTIHRAREGLRWTLSNTTSVPTTSRQSC
jgi:hypothetical protein